MLHNACVRYRFWNTQGKMDALARNADGDDLLFPHHGRGAFFCDYGHLSIREGDYLVIPRGTMRRIDFEAEVAVVLDDVSLGVAATRAGAHIKLVMLVNDVSLRGLIPGELAKGFGFLHGKPASAFAPVAVTPGELGAAWDGGKLHRPLVSRVNGREIGRPDAGVDMTFDFPTPIAHAARSRPAPSSARARSRTRTARRVPPAWPKSA